MITNILIFLVAALHIWFMALEMFLWEKPLGLRLFRMTAEKAAATKVLAANQGLYNGFLAAGLLWSLLHPDAATGRAVAIFFLSCIAAAGAYGGFSVSRRIFLVQGLPAVIALVLLFSS